MPPHRSPRARRWRLCQVATLFVAAGAGAPCLASCAREQGASITELDTVLRTAACHSPELLSALSAERRASSVYDEAAAALRPSLDLSIAAQAARDRPRTFNGDSSSASLPAVALSQTVYDSGASAARTRQRSDELLAQRRSTLATLRSVLSDAISKLVSLVSARAGAEALRENERVSRVSLAAVQARFEAGSATRVDVLSAEATLAESIRQRRSGEGDEARSAGQLANRLGVPSQALAIPDALGDFTRPLVASMLEGKPVDRIIEAVDSASPAVAERALRSSAALHQVESAKAASGWAVKWSAQTGPSRQSTGVGTRNSWHSEVSLTATLPLADGGARQARIGQALADAESARADVETQRLSAAQTAWTTWSQWTQARDALRSAQVALDSALALEQARRGQYAAGAGTLSDLLTAQTQLATQRKQFVSSRTDLAAAELSLLLALGAFDGYREAALAATR